MNNICKKTVELTENEKVKAGKMCGDIMTHILRMDSKQCMAKNLKLEEWQVNQNIEMMLYTLKRYVGWKTYLKILFRK